MDDGSDLPTGIQTATTRPDSLSYPEAIQSTRNSIQNPSEAVKMRIRTNRREVLEYVLSECEMDHVIIKSGELADDKEYFINGRLKGVGSDMTFSLKLRHVPSLNGSSRAKLEDIYSPILTHNGGEENDFNNFISGFGEKGLRIRYGKNGQYVLNK